MSEHLNSKQIISKNESNLRWKKSVCSSHVQSFDRL